MGTISTISTSKGGNSVHPHLRGDNDLSLVDKEIERRFTPTCVGTINTAPALLAKPTGSPPPAWGQCVLDGIVKTLVSVHPHLRGDNAVKAEEEALKNGSPPPAWGQSPLSTAAMS